MLKGWGKHRGKHAEAAKGKGGTLLTLPAGIPVGLCALGARGGERDAKHISPPPWDGCLSLSPASSVEARCRHGYQ